MHYNETAIEEFARDLTTADMLAEVQDERDDLRAALEALSGSLAERRQYLEAHGIYYDAVEAGQAEHETLEEAYARQVVRCALKQCGSGFSWRARALALEDQLVREPRQTSDLPIAVGELAHLQQRVEELERQDRVDSLVKAACIGPVMAIMLWPRGTGFLGALYNHNGDQLPGTVVWNALPTVKDVLAELRGTAQRMEDQRS